MTLDPLKPAALQALYPPFMTRSGRTIQTTEATSELTKEGLLVTVKTLFPPSERRRTELVVTAADGELTVRPLEPTAIADAQRFGERLRTSLGEAGPLRFVKDAGRATFQFAHRGPSPADKVPDTLPAARGNTRPPPANTATTEKGAS